MKNMLFCATLALLFSCSATKNQPLVGNWIEVMPANPQIVQGVSLHADGSASSIGMATLQYERWKTEDQKMILWGKSIGNGQTIDFSDTLTIIRITPDSLTLGNGGMYQINYIKVANIDSIKPFNIVDSLRISSDLGALTERNYQGILPAASCEGIEYTLKLYAQLFSGDGVYKLTLRYLGADKNGDSTFTTYGKQYTLRGDATNPDAVVLELIPLDGGEHIYLLRTGDNLELLNQKQERAASKLNYTLTLQNQ